MQDCHLFALSLKENVLRRPATGDDSEKVTEALKNVGLWDKVSTFENGVDTMITKEFDKSGEVLSGGEAQKLAISTVSTRNSRFVVLDEPSSALDPDSEYALNQAIMRCATEQNKTVIFISHRLSTTRGADRIYVFDGGEIVGQGTHEELMRDDSLYSRMFRVQAEKYQDRTAV